ncbi:MAG: mechanosensitive ion channel [Dehalococcoidia bacterium]|nr:mechanosensitive ion channel [Dehalococcoidia bacterium]
MLSATLGYASFRYQNTSLSKSFYSATAFTIIYFIFKLFFEEFIAPRISTSKTRYSLRRVIFMLYLLAFLATIVAIWVEDTQSLIVSYGLVAAGVAFALQEIFKSIAGGILIFVRSLYSIGDRIEINGKYGDVIDIGIMYTTILELREWVSGDQPTGRITQIQNSWVLSSSVNNYTKDHPYIWDEIHIPITFDSDWRKAKESILRIVQQETQDVTDAAVESVSALADKYYLPQRSEEPCIFLTITDNWISLHVRYITEVRKRRVLRSHLSRLILEDIEKSAGGKVKIASSTLDVAIRGVPDAHLNSNSLPTQDEPR